jgi:hypothetical protein
MLSKFFGPFRTARNAPRRAPSSRKESSSRRVRPEFEELESRFVPSGVSIRLVPDAVNHAFHYEITFDGTGNTVCIDHGWGLFTGGSILVTGLNGTQVMDYAVSQWGIQGPSTATGYAFPFYDRDYNDIWVDGGSGGNTIYVKSIARPLVIDSNASSISPKDHLYLGNGTLQGIQANVTLLDANNSLSVNLNGQNDTANRTVVLGGPSV